MTGDVQSPLTRPRLLRAARFSMMLTHPVLCNPSCQPISRRKLWGGSGRRTLGKCSERSCDNNEALRSDAA